MAIYAVVFLALPTARAADSDHDQNGQPEVVLWTFQAPEIQADALEKLREGLRSALPRENARHLLGEKALRTYVAGKTAPLPPCLIGLEACVTPQTLAFDALGLTLVIHVDVSVRGGEWVADCRWVDRRGQVAGEARVAAPTPRDLAYSLAGEIFDATATVSVKTDPEGASVEIDGDTVGTTPLTYRLALGEHRYRLSMESYQPIEGTFSLDGSGPAQIEQTLQPLPGAMILVGAPPKAEVYVDDARLGPADHRLELPAGRYDIEVRAEGFDAYHETVDLKPGQTIQRRVNMDKTHPLLRDVASEAIVLNRYIARITYDHGFQKTTFQDARTRVDNTHFSFLSFADKNTPNAIDRDLRRWVDPNGLRLDFSYHWENFGLVLLSVSYVSTSLNLDALLTSSGSTEPVPVEISHLSRLQLRPLQLRYRYFYKNLAPFVELGTGIDVEWVEAKGALLDRPVTLSSSAAFWTLGLGGSYYFTPNIFGMLRYGAQFYLDQGPGAEHVLSLGAGIALPNFFGVEPEPPEKL